MRSLAAASQPWQEPHPLAEPRQCARPKDSAPRTPAGFDWDTPVDLFSATLVLTEHFDQTAFRRHIVLVGFAATIYAHISASHLVV